MTKLTSIFVSKQFLLFLSVGGIAAVIHWLSRMLFNQFASYEVSLLLSYFVGIGTGYILNSKFVFSSSRDRRTQEIAHFCGFNLVMLPVVVAISWLLSEIIFMGILSDAIRKPTAHAIAVISPVFFNFIYHKYKTFKEA